MPEVHQCEQQPLQDISAFPCQGGNEYRLSEESVYYTPDEKEDM